MSQYVMMTVMAATLAVSTNLTAMMVARGATAETTGISRGRSPLDKTWTTWGQEKEAGSQVLAAVALTSPGSFTAEGKGVEPSTGYPAPDFESGC